MSDQAAAAAAAIGAPEELVMRSARARATAAGTSVEEVLAAWGGGVSVPTATPSASATPADAETVPVPASIVPEESVASEAPPASVDTASVDIAAESPVGSVGSGPVTIIDHRSDAAPVLVGRKDRPLALLVGLVSLFVLGALFAVALPGADARMAASEQLPDTTPLLSDLAIEGRAVYLQEGCFYCHTQLVRSVVTDVGLGSVTEPGTSPALSPETYGFQRVGPDLTHVGSREPSNDANWLRAFLRDPASQREGTLQPSYAYLSDQEMDALVQFLLESE